MPRLFQCGPTMRMLLLVLALLTSASCTWARAHPRARGSAGDEHAGFLDAPVRNFDNARKPFIPTLLLIASAYRVPMGIERVVAASEKRPISVRMVHGTVAGLLSLCVSKAPGYAWKVDAGVVNVYGPAERASRSNLFNAVVQNFTATNSTLNEVNNRLRDLAFSERAGKKPQNVAGRGAVGTFGDSPGIGGWEAKRFSITMRRATIRDVLNRIVALSQSAGQMVAWIANAPPDKLDTSPANGLWRFVPLQNQ